MAERFEELDMSIIEGVEWAQNLRQTLYKCTDKCFLNWCNIVMQLGEEEVELDKWIEIFRRSVEERYSELVMDVLDMKSKTIDRIAELLEKTETYAKELGVKEDFLDINPNEKYYLVIRELSQRSERLEKMMDERRKHIDALINEQKHLCHLLEKPAMQVPERPKLPSVKELDKLQQYIESLKQEKFDREEKYIKLRDEITEIAQALEIQPKTDFQRQILSTFSADFDISESNLKQLIDFHEDIKKQMHNVKEDINHLRKSIDNLWTVLEESMSEKNSFNARYSDYSMSTLKALRQEYKRCEDIKKANIKTFVDKLRSELNVLWNKCYYNNIEDLGNYPWLTSDLYTEDLLTYHEMEVSRWKRFFTENQTLLKYFGEHEKLWNCLLEMENKDSADLNRYKNRGGQLLKEEKERNKLSKKIPNLEERIKQLAEKYEELHGSSFQVFGKPILEHIENLHIAREQVRKEKLSAKKNNRDHETITPAKSCASLLRSKMYATPQPISGTKRKLVKAETTGKKIKMEVQKKQLTLSSVGPQTANRIKRHSIEKKKRISKCRKLLQLKGNSDNKENHEESNAINYDTFERNLSDRATCRSTLNALDPRSPLRSIPTLNIIPCTPINDKASTVSKTPATPRSADKHTKTPKEKLTRTPSALKLIF